MYVYVCVWRVRRRSSAGWIGLLRAAQLSEWHVIRDVMALIAVYC
jgi:hypothetical protein